MALHELSVMVSIVAKYANGMDLLLLFVVVVYSGDYLLLCFVRTFLKSNAFARLFSGYVNPSSSFSSHPLPAFESFVLVHNNKTELAHQWFGNLATMEFWTQLYLKEGVARYMEFVAIDHLFPEWKAWTEFVQSVYTLALSLDALNTSHPVEVEVNHPDEITEIFDAISYAKGASLIRMVATYIGESAFRKGMQTYLQRFA